MKNRLLIIVISTTIVILTIIILFGINSGILGMSIGEKETINIGFIGPLSGPGSAWGLEQQKAMEIALKEIGEKNQANGKQIRIIYENGKCNGKEAVNAATKLINIDNARVIIPVCSSETLSISPIAEKDKIIVLAVWPTDNQISNAGDYVFRLSYSDRDTAIIMAETIEKNHGSVGIITELDAYSVGLRDEFKKYFNGTIYEEDFASQDKNIGFQIARVLQKHPEAIIINPNYPSSGLEVLKQLRLQGFKGQIYTNYFGSTNTALESNESEGMIFFDDPLVGNNSKKDNLFDKYREEYGKKPDFEFAVSASYDVIYILNNSLARCSENTDCIKEYLYNTRFEGALGNFSFDENGDLFGVKPSVKQIRDNKPVLIN